MEQLHMEFDNKGLTLQYAISYSEIQQHVK